LVNIFCFYFLLLSFGCSVFDLGGARSERRKWIHCFENVNTVFYTLNLAQFDLCLYEDEGTNAFEEALALFKELFTSRWFNDTKFVVFFTHLDVFLELVQVKGFEQLVKLVPEAQGYFTVCLRTTFYILLNLIDLIFRHFYSC